MPLRQLSPLEARVLCVLVEKAHTVPDSYPLSLNTLTLGCNQKTARDPVIQATEAEVQVALEALIALSLVFERSGSRVSRYEHNMARVLALPSASVALLSTLGLRGPQTSAELRANAERLHRFADVSSVEGFLEELSERAEEKGGPLVRLLPRAPGAREPRWVHLMCGEPAVEAPQTAIAETDFVAAGELASLKAQNAALQAEVAELRLCLQAVCEALGLRGPGASTSASASHGTSTGLRP